MKIFGFEITKVNKTLLPPVSINTSAGAFNWLGGIIRESFTGAWQRNVEIRLPNVMTFSAVYACVSMIASDIGKLKLSLVQKTDDDIWEETENPAFSPVLRKPNHYQTRQKFIESWITAKLMFGNAYILKEFDQRGVVIRLYPLDPQLTTVLIAPDGAVYYQLSSNRLAGIEGVIGVDMSEVNTGSVTVPAKYIIHDVMVPLYHPLLGVSPIYACGLAAVQGLAIQNNSAKFFANGSRPGGILTAPGAISDETAKRLKDYWDVNFTGENAGKIAVLGDGLKYEAMAVSAQDAQLINQLKWTSETVCTAFHVPPNLIGVGNNPRMANVEAENLQYYSQCLQPLMEAIEALLDEGLGLQSANQQLGTEFDLDDLLKMDTNTQVKTYGEGIIKGLLAPNEGRRKLNLPPVDGGDDVYLQQQNFSLSALAKRDAKADPFSTNTPKPSTPALPKPPPDAAVTPPPPAKEFVSEEWYAALKKEYDQCSR